MSKSFKTTIEKKVWAGKEGTIEMDCEEEIEVFYTMSPADPSVGILRAWPEIDSVKDSSGCEVDLRERDEERILEAIAEKEDDDYHDSFDY